MASSRLLLLIGVISSHLPEVQGKPIDFWCKDHARKSMETKLETLKKNMAHCNGSDSLPSPVQLPCIGVLKKDWENKTLQHKRAEVMGALQVFQEGVQGVSKKTTVGCQTQLLRGLELIIKNHLVIVRTLLIQNDTVTPSDSAVQHCSNQTNLNEVLKQYGCLLRGKLTHLAKDVQDSLCKVEDMTINT
ncbi:uncharacterized protein LOC108888164 [Lates japonicus]|uniref:Thrombopoietin n=1 Tax=Lates japonicus TaxID=270547 RepID=A0AAD3R2P4_LATJO|nr:uncharacterized protein AKAME5_000572000 [Lates japonicus]